LDAEPTLFDVTSGSGAGDTVAGDTTGLRPAGTNTPGGSATGFTDEDGSLLPPERHQVAPDPEVLRRAQQIASRLVLPTVRRSATSRRGAGELASVRFRGGSDDIDLDATLDRLVERPVPDDEDIIVRERVRTRRAVVLAVDISGSMGAERVRTAAATVGALAGELHRDDLSVVAFWSDAAVLVRPGQPIEVARLIDALLRLPARGLTNIAFPLSVARSLLSGLATRDSRVLLLSDCVHNAGPDPRPLAAALPRLDVLLDTSGEHDLESARDLARIGRGRLAPVHHFGQVAPAISRCFAG
jgi:Mg-chelatase subunit ChlD